MSSPEQESPEQGGQKLLQFVNDQWLDRYERLALFDQVCEIVEHYHAFGLVFGDLHAGRIRVFRGRSVPRIAITQRPRLALPVSQVHEEAKRMSEELQQARHVDLLALGEILCQLLREQEHMTWKWRALMRKSTSEDVNERYPTVKSFRQDIALVLGLAPGAQASLEMGSESEQAQRYVRWSFETGTV